MAQTYRIVHDDQVMVGGRDIGSTGLEPLPVNRRLHGNWASFLKDAGYEIVPTCADVNDDADRGGDVGRKGSAERSDRADGARRTADGDDSPLASVHISLRVKGLACPNEKRAAGKLDSASSLTTCLLEDLFLGPRPSPTTDFLEWS